MAGAVDTHRVVGANGAKKQLGHLGETQMAPGDGFVIDTPGGG